VKTVKAKDRSWWLGNGERERRGEGKAVIKKSGDKRQRCDEMGNGDDEIGSCQVLETGKHPLVIPKKHSD
jgi:hypothetical protein